MTKLEQLYNSIQNLKELGVQLPDKLIEETNRVEEEVIKKDVIPLLAKTINPLITQIQRELVIVIDYIPDEPITVKLTRKRNVINPEESTIKISSETISPKKSYTISPHTKASKTGLLVKLPNGKTISEKFAYQTLIDCIKYIGYERVSLLGIRCNGVPLISSQKDDFYRQVELKPRIYIITHSSTYTKKQQFDEISRALKLGLKVEII